MQIIVYKQPAIPYLLQLEFWNCVVYICMDIWQNSEKNKLALIFIQLIFDN